MKLSSRVVRLALFLAAPLCSPIWGAVPPQPGTANPGIANPGTVNYVEGGASIGDRALDQSSVGSVQLTAGQLLSTQDGRVELLLTPGVFLRVGHNTAVEMVSPDLVNTILTLQRGRALIEVTDIHPENNLVINQNGAGVRIEKP